MAVHNITTTLSAVVAAAGAPRKPPLLTRFHVTNTSRSFHGLTASGPNRRIEKMLEASMEFHEVKLKLLATVRHAKNDSICKVIVNGTLDVVRRRLDALPDDNGLFFQLVAAHHLDSRMAVHNITTLSTVVAAAAGSPRKPPLLTRFHVTHNLKLMKNEKKKDMVVTVKAAFGPNRRIGKMLEASVEFHEVKLKVLATVRHARNDNVGEIVMDGALGIMRRRFDAFADYNDGLFFQLVAAHHLDSRTGEPKLSSEAVLKWSKSNIQKTGNRKEEGDSVTYGLDITVPSDFGVPGAIIVTNKYPSEFFLESIAIEGIVHFSCNSWVQPDNVNPEIRIFFNYKAYLPWDTPLGLQQLRETELRQLRGDGKGLRRLSDRIYDYDVYNDLGDPDKGDEFGRPALGGQKHPHPRRCRTGRPPTRTDIHTEKPSNMSTPMYVPRDEAMAESKKEDISVGKLKGTLRNVIPSLTNTLSSDDDQFKQFYDIYGLYREHARHGMKPRVESFTELPLPNIWGKGIEYVKEFLKFDPPKIISRDITVWLRDDEFGRQMLAGINPVSLEKLKVFPPVSKLDSSIYGPPESALKVEHIANHLDGISVQQALDENKLFILDYHDFFLPFLNGINALEGRKSYATRTIFFLTSLGTLKPIAIELSLPPLDSKTSSKQVVTPPVDATTNWLWQLSKTYVCNNDAGVHQLVHHWLRVHACIEPFIISAHRQMSVMHPGFKLLDPHMRYTLEINAEARKTLISAGGIIESNFTPAKYCMQISCAAYKDWWRFDMEGLPADLIRRGMAIPDPTQPHGLKLLIEDYPYAADGLLLWSAIETLVQTYVNYYYPEASMVSMDTELQAWYNEAINVGHADVKDSTWWPALSTSDDLISILTIIIWITSGQHAALNFGQYPYGGYVPVRPPLMRKLMPKENEPEYAGFVRDPYGHFLSSLPSMFQATKFMAVIDIISTHSPDEEYLGERKDLSAWSGEPEILEAFYRFTLEIRRIEREIEKRNEDPKLRNRCGPGVVPYELLIPSSGPGATGRGVPNSVTV